ncbi:MAG: hypothetical protein ABI304_13480 [Rudaea sp.]
MKPASARRLFATAALLCAATSFGAIAATHSENFDSASGNANAFQSASGMYFSSSSGAFVFSTQFNSYFSPYISGKFSTTGCNGCFPQTMDVAWPVGQRALVFGWGTQGYPAVKVTAYRDGQQVWQQTQSGTASNGLYKQQFNRTSANAAEYFDQVAITFSGGGQSGTGYGILLDNFSSTDAYAALQLTGNKQIAPINTVYAMPLQVVVRDYQNNPVSGVTVNFSAPTTLFGSVPTVTFDATNDTFDSAVTDSDGLAVSSNMTANAMLGALMIDVSTSPTTAAALFKLTNVSADTIFENDFE